MLLACVCSTGSFALAAENITPVTLDPAQGQVPVQPSLTLLRDPTSALTLDDVMAASADFHPLQGKEKSMNFGYVRDVLWLRLPLQSLSTEEQRWLLEFEFAYLDDIRVFVVHDDHRTQMKAGLSYPVGEWEIVARKPVFPVQLDAGEDVTVYIRAESEAPLVLNMRMSTPNAFNLSENRVVAFLALYFGMLVALGLYNLLLFITLRQREFLIYTCFVLTFGIAASHMNGVAQLTLSQFSVHSPYMVPTGFALAATLAVLFARRFLWLRDTLPMWHRALGFIAVLWAFGTLVTQLVSPQRALEIMSIMGVLTTISLMSAGIVAMRRKVPAAGIFVFAWTLLLLGTSMLAIRNTGWLPSNSLTVYGMQFGSATEMLLLSFALAARFTDMKRQKEKAQQELVRTLVRQERELEDRVARRTRELEEAKARLQQIVHKDILTGLPNRSGLAAYFAEFREKADARQPVAVMLIDLDGFKPVNDEFGHDAGDDLLRDIARHLQGALAGDEGIIGRLGGDEFVVLLTGFAERSEVTDRANDILRAIAAAKVTRDGVSVSVAASIGICFGYGADVSLKSLVTRADHAMYEVKRSGKQGIFVSNEDAELAL